MDGYIGSGARLYRAAPDLGHEPPEWTLDALCLQFDPAAWFPEKGGSTREAKLVCQRCPVRAECLAFAFDHDERYGIHGGLSERERRRLFASGWQPGDPIPDVRIDKAITVCPDCGKACLALATHARTAHGTGRVA